MNLLKFITSFRAQLIISGIVITSAIFIFDFYIFTQTYTIGVVIKQGILSHVQIAQLERQIDILSRITFGFLVVTTVILLSIFMNVIVTYTVSIKTILKHIKAIEDGNLQMRFPIYAGDEFGSIARFLDRAAKRIEKTQHELVVEKANVERKVEERTRDLRIEEARLLASINSISLGFIMTDSQHTIMAINPAMEHIIGPDSLIRTIEDIQKKIHSDIVINDHITKTMETKQPVDLRDVRLADKTVRILFAPIIIQKQTAEVIGAVILIEDLSGEKELEEMKLDFVSMAAHELRTPLTSIKGYVSVLAQETEKKFTEEQNMFLNRIAISTEQLVSLVDNLLNVTKIEKGAFTINRQLTAWVPLVQQNFDGLQNRAQEKKIEFTFIKPKEDIPPLFIDPLSMSEVLLNLLSNAISYTPQGGRVSIFIERKNEMIITHIKDTGEGIPQKALTHLFTKFFRVSGKLEQGSKGNGLGLYISKAIVEMHGGTIWVESELEKGSCFSFSVPIENNG